MTTAKQKLFIYHYLSHFNATRAAKEAGYSEKSARGQGSRLLATPEIRKAVDEAAAAQADELSTDVVLTELYFIVTARPDYYVVAEDGTVDVKPGIDRRYLGAVAGVKRRVTRDFEGNIREESGPKIQLWNKPAGLQISAKALGMLRERIEIAERPNVRLYIPENPRFDETDDDETETKH